MARGKQKGVVSLKDTVPDNEIVRNGEVKNEPNYLLDDEHGISGGYKDYSLVKKRMAYRTGKEEDGVDCGKVIEYTIWEDYPCYVGDLEGIFDSYARILNLTEFKTKKMMKSIEELVEIRKNTDDKINKALGGIDKYLTREQKEVCKLADTKEKLVNDINELREKKNEMIKIMNDINRMHKEIKEANTIIVNRDKPKKHRVKLEKE